MDISEKLTQLNQSVEKLSNNDYEKIEKRLQEEINNSILNEIIDYEQKKAEAFEKVQKGLERDYNKKIYNYETQCKKEIIEQEKKLTNNIKDEAIIILKEYTDDDNYINFLQNNIKQSLMYVNQKDETTIGLTKKDIDRFEKLLSNMFNIKVKQIDDKYIGGSILENKEQGIYIENTLLNSVNEKLKI